MLICFTEGVFPPTTLVGVLDLGLEILAGETPLCLELPATDTLEDVEGVFDLSAWLPFITLILFYSKKYT